MRNKYLLYSGLIVAVGLVLSHSSLVNAATGTLEEAWNAITKLQTDLKNVQFTSGLPGPKTIEFSKNQLVNTNLTTRWFEIGGGYNRIAFKVDKTEGAQLAAIKKVSIEFTNDSTNNTAVAEQAVLNCQATKCDLITLQVLAKFYRIKIESTESLRFSAYGYLTTDGFPGPKGPQGLTGPKGDKGDPSTRNQLHLYDGNGQDLGISLSGEGSDVVVTYIESIKSTSTFSTNRNGGGGHFEPTGGIGFSEPNCLGTAFVEDFNGAPASRLIMLSNNKGKIYKSKGNVLHNIPLRSQLLIVSEKDDPTACHNIPNQPAILFDVIEAEEITTPFNLPIVWPLEIK